MFDEVIRITALVTRQRKDITTYGYWAPDTPLSGSSGLMSCHTQWVSLILVLLLWASRARLQLGVIQRAEIRGYMLLCYSELVRFPVFFSLLLYFCILFFSWSSG